MSQPPVTFELLGQDTGSAARRGRLSTPHGTIETPCFMPVGTVATVKGLDIPAVKATGAQIILGNTYHLALRPGSELVRELGGLHQFMGWDGPILTDSGGFQLFSLAQMTRIDERGAVFRSHIDGSLLELTPERAVAIQEDLGSDIAMVLDHVVGLPCDRATLELATARTVRWAQRCKDAARRPDQAQFAIVQGGLDIDLRLLCTEQLAALDFPGYAIGGLSVGEEPAEMYRILAAMADALPRNKPRYLMGVGRPEDLLEAINHGVDMFDCVLPTRNGRNALAFTASGTLRLRNKKHQRDPRPLEEDCPCPACRHSRAYIRHLFMAKEMLGPILLTAHNLTYYQRLMQQAREAIETGRYTQFLAEARRGWQREAAEQQPQESAE